MIRTGEPAAFTFEVCEAAWLDIDPSTVWPVAFAEDLVKRIDTTIYQVGLMPNAYTSGKLDSLDSMAMHVLEQCGIVEAAEKIAADSILK
jgi:hypothetical protein